MRKQSARLDDLHDLFVFARVVEARSFSAAARALGTTTSAISKRIAHLEARLGVRLLERTTRRVGITEAGASLHGHAARILADVEQAESAVARHGTTPRGTLRVSAPVLLGERHVAPLLAPLLERHPELRVELSLSDRFVNLVEERFDVAVRVGPPQDASLVAVRVAEAEAVVCASPSYVAKHGAPSSPADLVSCNAIRFSLVPAAQEWRFVGPKGRRSVPVTGNLEINHGGAIREAALAGIGVVRVPSFLVADALATGALVRLLADARSDPFPIHVVYPSGGRASPKVRAFVDVVGDGLRKRLGARKLPAARRPSPT